ncbi:MAG: phospholipase, partial [Gammaproteobacteria bacterium]|nr:phospholipase [Gammaproteobacteria bacterium]
YNYKVGKPSYFALLYCFFIFGVKKMKKWFRSLSICSVVMLVFLSTACFSASVSLRDEKPLKTIAEKRAKKENILPANYFLIDLYKPSYILPYYVTFSPDDAVYQNNTPHNESLKKSEFKYQISLKVPLWKRIFDSHSSLILAYTQLSYWQLYNSSEFFRETDYEPELFLANQLGWRLSKNWQFTFMNLGVMHQSNGFGNQLERSWNRLYLEAIVSSENSMISLKPWYILTTHPYNRNIAQYLGYGRLLVAYKFHQQVISLQAHNILESGGKHKTVELTYSFPLTPYIKGYVQAFSGYGQSLIEYNHRTNSLGIGVAFNDWV